MRYRFRVLKNIIPATFEETLTYIEQLNLLKDKINEIIEALNEAETEEEENTND